MDARRFEDVSRRMGAASNRRAAVRVLAAAVMAPLFGHWWTEEVDAGVPIANCKAPGKKCSSNRRCCSGRCKRGRCTCSKKGRRCWSPLEGALCCSQRCKNGKCK